MANIGKEWSVGLCGCFGDCKICLTSFFCPCVQIARNAEYFGEDKRTACCLNCWCGCPYNLITRTKLRTQLHIPGNMSKDIAEVMCCARCAIAQEAQEIKACRARGMDGNSVVTIQPMKKIGETIHQTGI